MNSPVTRKSSYNRDELELCARGVLFEPGSARLPTGNMLMCDRIVEINADGGANGKGYIKAELDIHPDLWFFGCHFIGDPVMPGCLGLDALWQLCGFFLTWSGCEGKGRALGADNVKFTGQILPTANTVTYVIDVKRVITRKLNLIIADGTVAVDERVIYTAENLRVGLFTATDSF